MHVQRGAARELSKSPMAKPRRLIEIGSEAKRDRVYGAKVLLEMLEEPARVIPFETD